MRVFLPSMAAAAIVLLGPWSVAADAGRTAETRQLFLSAAASPETDSTLYAVQRRELAGYVLAPYLERPFAARHT